MFIDLQGEDRTRHILGTDTILKPICPLTKTINIRRETSSELHTAICTRRRGDRMDVSLKRFCSERVVERSVLICMILERLVICNLR